MSHVAPQIPIVAVGETRNAKVDFTDLLDSGESLTGTPTVTEVTTSDLTIDNKAVNTTSVTILNRTVTAGKAVQFRFSGQSVDIEYTISVTASTGATPPQTFVRLVKFRCH